MLQIETFNYRWYSHLFSLRISREALIIHYFEVLSLKLSTQLTILLATNCWYRVNYINSFNLLLWKSFSIENWYLACKLNCFFFFFFCEKLHNLDFTFHSKALCRKIFLLYSLWMRKRSTTNWRFEVWLKISLKITP